MSDLIRFSWGNLVFDRQGEQLAQAVLYANRVQIEELIEDGANPSCGLYALLLCLIPYQLQGKVQKIFGLNIQDEVVETVARTNRDKYRPLAGFLVEKGANYMVLEGYPDEMLYLNQSPQMVRALGARRVLSELTGESPWENHP